MPNRRMETLAEIQLIEQCQAYSAALGLAYKTVPMSGGAEPRIGLGFQTSGNLKTVVARLSIKKMSSRARAYSRLKASSARSFGQSIALTKGSMRSLTILPWPLPTELLKRYLNASVEAAKVELVLLDGDRSKDSL